LTIKTRTQPSAKTPALRLIESQTASPTGLRTEFLNNGSAEIMPIEKTKDPTPKSIYRSIQFRVFYCRGEMTYDGGAPGLCFGKGTGEEGKIDGEDADDGHNHHFRSINRHKNFSKARLLCLVDFLEEGSIGENASRGGTE